METIAVILIEYGMAFEYEHFGADGERIICYQLGVDVTLRNDKYIIEHEGRGVFSEDVDVIKSNLMEIIIEETN